MNDNYKTVVIIKHYKTIMVTCNNITSKDWPYLLSIIIDPVSSDFYSNYSNSSKNLIQTIILKIQSSKPDQCK